mgnify:CR=1 FL=1
MFYIASKLLAFLIKPIIWVFILLIGALIKAKRRKLLNYLTKVDVLRYRSIVKELGLRK